MLVSGRGWPRMVVDHFLIIIRRDAAVRGCPHAQRCLTRGVAICSCYGGWLGSFSNRRRLIPSLPSGSVIHSSP